MHEPHIHWTILFFYICTYLNPTKYTFCGCHYLHYKYYTAQFHQLTPVVVTFESMKLSIIYYSFLFPIPFTVSSAFFFYFPVALFKFTFSRI